MDKGFIVVVDNFDLENLEFLPEFFWAEEIIPRHHIMKIYKYKSMKGDKENQEEVFAICYVWFDFTKQMVKYFHQKFDSKIARDIRFLECCQILEGSAHRLTEVRNG